MFGRHTYTVHGVCQAISTEVKSVRRLPLLVLALGAKLHRNLGFWQLVCVLVHRSIHADETTAAASSYSLMVRSLLAQIILRDALDTSLQG